MAITGMDYAIDFSVLSDVDPWTDTDWTDTLSTFKIVSGNLHPYRSGATKTSKMVLDNLTIDRTATTVDITVELGVGSSVYHDVGGPAWLVPTGHADAHKGYWFRQNGNNIYLYQIDTGTAASLGSSIKSYGAASWVTGDKLTMRIAGIGSSPTISCYRNGTQLGTSQSVTSYTTTGEPGIVADSQDSNYRGWTAFGFTGLDLGGFSLDDVNGDDVIDHDTAFVVNGDFSGVTISSVTLTQTDATDKTVSFTETDTQLSCTAIDFHASSEIFEGAAIIEVYDGTDTVTLDVTIDFSNDYDTTIAASIDSVKGIFRDITGAAVGHYLHSTPAISTSAVEPREDGPYASIYPAVAAGSTATWWHGNPTTRVWTQIDLVINQVAATGPVWDTTMPSWTLTAGVVGNLDISANVVAGSGSLDSWAVNPAVSGMSIDTAGELECDGTIDAGALWLTVDVADDDATNTSPQIAVTIEPYPLQLSNDSVTSIGQHTATITVDALTADGDIYAAVRTTGAYTDSDIAAIKAGTGAVWYQDKESALTLPFYVTALAADTTLYYGVVQSDGGLDSNVLAGTFDTLEEISFTDFGKAPVVRP